MTERESPWKKKPQHTHRPSRAPSPRDIATEEHQHAREHREAELRLYGVNAVKAAFHRRPDALRKLYLVQDRIPHPVVADQVDTQPFEHLRSIGQHKRPSFCDQSGQTL